MTVNQWLYNWASSQIASPVIFRDQNGPQPEGDYVTIKAIAFPREGEAEYSDVTDANGITQIKHSMLVTCSVQSFGSDPFGTMTTLRNSLEKISVQQALRADGLCYMGMASEPTDVAAIVGTEFEARATMDVIFRVPVIIEDDVGLIESNRFTGTADGMSVTKTVTQGGIA